MIAFHLERGLCSICSDLPVRKSTPLCVSVGCLPDISSCSKQSLPFSFLCITGETSHSVSADALPLATVYWSLVFSSPDSFPRILVLHPSLDHGVSPCPWSTFHLAWLYLPQGLMEKPLQKSTLDFTPSDEGIPPGALFLNFCTSWKGPVAWTLVLSIHPICPVPSVLNLPEMPQSPHPTSKWSSLPCACGVQVSHYMKSFDHLFEVWVGSKNQN